MIRTEFSNASLPVLARTTKIRMNTRLLALVSFTIAAVCASSGCAGPRPPRSPLKIRLAVLDLLPPGQERLTKDFKIKQREGWWFGSQDVYQDPNVGIRVADMLANLLAGRLNRSDSLTVDSRYDFRIYLENKKERLQKQFPKLTKAQIDELALNALVDNPAEVGRELQVDRVLTGQIVDERMDNSRFWQFWTSRLVVRLGMFDVETGKIVFDRVFTKTRFCGSPDMVAQALADDVAEWMAKQYGY